jgi:hypothetical protein
MRMTRQPPGCGHLAEKPAPVTLGEEHPVVHLDRDFPADGELPAPVHGGEAARAEDAADPMPGNVRCRDHDRLA